MTADDLLEILRRDVVEASKALLGATLVRGGMSARIVETEAYRGIDDPACHAFGRPKMKNMALYGEPGNSYVYFTYGNHWMLNVVALEAGAAAAVLIRAAEPLTGIRQFEENRGVLQVRNLLSGPGKLAKAFGIDSTFNDRPLLDVGEELHLIPREANEPRIMHGPRIGIAVGKWHDVPWRFVDSDRLEWISRPLPPGANKRNNV